MQRFKALTLLTVIAGLASACAGGPQAADPTTPAQLRETALGLVFTDTRGMTLYVHKDDPPGESTCNGRCARKWPPLLAPADAEPTGRWSVIDREDGTRQWAYDAKPVYGWVKDEAPGQTTGHKRGNAWYVARP